MPAKEKRWLDYGGETTAELIGLADEFRVDSILCAFEEALGHKRQLTAEERVLVSIMGLDREVSNGGFLLFFYNSSRRYAQVIAENLERIGASKTARLAAEALESRRDEKALAKLNPRYFKANEIEEKLWEFVQASRERFVLPVRKNRRQKPEPHEAFIAGLKG